MQTFMLRRRIIIRRVIYILQLLSCLLVVMFLVRLSQPQTMPRQMTIAAIFDQGGDPKHELAFRHAVQSINRNR